MGFADPTVCPRCRGAIEAATRCPHCGLDLTTHEIQQAWQALVVADQWVARATEVQSAAPASVPTPAGTAPPPAHPPAADVAPPRQRKLSAGSVLLGLGAMFILVAGSIFISVSWGSLGVVGRALVLLAFTALVGVLGWVITRRGLRASAEALWTVFLGLLTLDWFAARDQGLAGLDRLPFGASAAAWAVLVIGAALVVVRGGRRRLGAELIAPSIIAGFAAWFAAGSLAAELDAAETAFWPALLATAAVTAAGLVLLVGGVRVGAWICAVGAVLSGVVASGSAVIEAVDHPAVDDLVANRHGLPLLVVVLVAAVTGVVVTRGRWAASAVVVAGVSTLVALPVEEAWDDRGGYVVVSGLLVVGAVAFARGGDWFRGGRLAVSLGWVGLVLAASPWVAGLLDVIAEGATSSRTDDLRTRLRPDDVADVGPWWLAAVVAAALAVSLVAARRWPESRAVRDHLVPAAACAGVLGALMVVATLAPPAIAIGGASVAGGAVLAASLGTRGWRWIGPGVVALAPLSTLSSWPASVLVWPVAGVVLAFVALRTQDAWLRRGSGFVATGWGLGTTAAVFELVSGDDRWTALGLVIAGVVGLGVALFAIRDDPTATSVEAASSVLGVGGLVLGSVDSTLGFTSFLWTVAGAGVVVLGLASARRRWYRWAGSALLGTAYVLRLAASEVDVVEAYTLPFAILLLVAGLWAMRDSAPAAGRPDAGTPARGPGSMRALLPGVTLALVPSLPQALDEPTGLRALLLGVAAAVALGVGTWRRWKVPFVAGAAVLALLVLVNVGPLALALPRWVLIASVGAVLLAAGITWEERVRDGRAAARYVGSMR